MDTDIAMESADVVLMRSDPFDVVGAIGLSRITVGQNASELGLGSGYNVIAFSFRCVHLLSAHREP
jgi:cation transport ATPase